jgi:uncharacterized cupin superfamily protein
VVPEAPLEQTATGLVPRGEGWYVLNARDATWYDGVFGAYTRFEGDARFAQIGINLAVLSPGQPACMYHREDNQENFLVLAGECRLLVEGEERLLRAWDFVHCPAWTDHVFVGAGEGDCLILALGGRTGEAVVYPVSELAQKHGASVERETHEPREAYAKYPKDAEVLPRPEWLRMV